MSLLEENADILAEMERDGSDLGPARSVDFSHVFPDQLSAEAFAAECERDGFKIDIVEIDRDEDPWDVTVSTDMQPSAVNITSWEERFDARAETYGGRSDGWGFFRV
ncbi:ribonuclease E inhibitor RraB [Novosphingobium lindaniclasticum]